MKILLACDKYKGSLSAKAVNTCIEKGFSTVFPEAEFVHIGISDGGEGFVQSLVESAGGEIVTSVVEDALGREIEAEWGLIPHADGGKAAVIEMSAASGLWRISEEERDIMKASTYGTGQLIKAALEIGDVKHLYLGLGGSATNDGGTGMAQALGVQFFAGDKVISERMCPALLPKVTKIGQAQRISVVPITVACDVDSPLCGKLGASAVFGPQKGATPELVPVLDEYLSMLSQLIENKNLAVISGAGAAGGMGFGLMAFAEAQLVSGFDLVADASGLKREIEGADLIITGEGKLDSQSLAGKGPIGVANLSKELGKSCLAIAGGMDDSVDWSPYFKDYASLGQTGLSLNELMENAEKYLTKTAVSLAKCVR